MSMERLHKYSINAAISALNVKYNLVGSEFKQVRIFNGEYLPSWVLGAAGGLGASVLADVFTSVVAPHLDMNALTKGSSGAIIPPATGAASYLIMNKFVAPDFAGDLGTVKIAASGALSELVAQWAHDHVIHPSMNGSNKQVEQQDSML